jgi:hypothetical protein
VLPLLVRHSCQETQEAGNLPHYPSLLLLVFTHPVVKKLEDVLQDEVRKVHPSACGKCFLYEFCNV